MAGNHNYFFHYCFHCYFRYFYDRWQIVILTNLDPFYAWYFSCNFLDFHDVRCVVQPFTWDVGPVSLCFLYLIMSKNSSHHLLGGFLVFPLFISTCTMMVAFRIKDSEYDEKQDKTEYDEKQLFYEK